MNTNIKISTTDEERVAIAHNTGNPLRMVSRKDINILVEKYIGDLIAGSSNETDPGPDAEVEAVIGVEPATNRDSSIRGFVPSRGDEPYLYRPEDPELAAQCSAILDGLEFIERHAWATLERNRE